MSTQVTMKIMIVLCLAAAYIATVRASCEGYGDGSTMCLKKAPCTSSDSGVCGGVTNDDITTILEAHNSYRELVASGKESRGSPSGPQPKGTNIYEMQWSDELAAFAQRWADQKVKAGHDCYPCRETEDFKFVGQNMYMTFSGAKMPKVSWEDAVKNWYEEVKFVNPTTLKSNTKNAVGHYTQVLWAKTWLVGCGVYGDSSEKCGWQGSSYKNDYCLKYVCNYAPAGNFNNAAPYLSTEKCTKSSKNYPHLCAK